MKTKNLILGFLLCSVSIFSQKKNFDPKIMGCYKGLDEGLQIENVSRYWISCRLDKGKSILLFITKWEDGNITQHTENGQWWTKDGKYYEFHKDSGLTDIYNYEVLENGNIKFNSIEIIGKKDDTYSFIDYKIED